MIIKQFKLKTPHNSKYLFVEKVGIEHYDTFITDTAIREYFKDLCRKYNLPVLRIHDLRHTHCSLLIFKGMSIHYISKRLGHRNVTITLEKYSHLIDEFEQRENEKIDSVMEDLECKNSAN